MASSRFFRAPTPASSAPASTEPEPPGPAGGDGAVGAVPESPAEPELPGPAGGDGAARNGEDGGTRESDKHPDEGAAVPTTQSHAYSHVQDRVVQALLRKGAVRPEQVREAEEQRRIQHSK